MHLGLEHLPFASRFRISYKQIGQNIRTRRLAEKMSQEELGFKINSTRNYIGCIERGEKFPSLAILMDIAIALKCSLQDLCENV